MSSSADLNKLNKSQLINIIERRNSESLDDTITKAYLDTALKRQEESIINSITEKYLLAIEELRKEHSEEIRLLNEKITKQNDLIDTQMAIIETLDKKNLKNVIIDHAITLEKIEMRALEQYAIVSNVEEENFIETIDNHLNKIGIERDNGFSPKQLGEKKPGRKRPIRIKFKAKEDKMNAINNTIKLYKDNSNSSEEKERIYINSDLPKKTRMENSRLRKEKKNLQENNKKSKVSIIKGNLYLENRIVDSFNLENQIF